MDPLEEANKIVNNIPEDKSWLVVEYDMFSLIVDNLRCTPTNLIMNDGRKFKIVPDNEND